MPSSDDATTIQTQRAIRQREKRSEPVNIRLTPSDDALLNAVAAATGLTVSDVMRQGLHAFAANLGPISNGEKRR